MLGELNDEFIMSGEDMDINNLFSDTNETEEIQESKPEQTKEELTTDVADIDANNLFSTQESVGSGKDNQEAEEDTTPDKGKSTSPDTNFYSSIAQALKGDGVFPDLDDDTLNTIKSPEDLAKAIETLTQSRLDARQQRIEKALNGNIESSDILMYETTLHNLDAIQENHILDESEQGEQIRQNLIYQDFINKGYTAERATREVKKSFNAGTDIEDAKDALNSNKQFFSKQYQDLVDEGQSKVQQQEEQIKKESAELKKVMLEDKEILEGLSLTSQVRKQAYDNITKPSYKTEDGQYITAIQKYEKENPVDFRRNLSVLFTMTDGFKNIKGLIGGTVKKEVKQHLRELEHKLQNPSRANFGNPRFVGGIDEEEDNSYSGKGFDLDV